MCIRSIQYRKIEGSAKGVIGWFGATHLAVCNDHPHHLEADWSINIDVVNEQMEPSARVALELTLDSAKALAEAILAVVRETEEEEAEIAAKAKATATEAASRG